jgi:formyl-CoA transferase
MTDNETKAALGDIRVLEMGQLLAGPFCAQLLGDFGAEVIKIEPPSKGDAMREWGREKPHGLSLWFPVLGRNKKSVTINLRTEEGQQLVRRLVAHADVMVENFRPGTLERWNLDYETLSSINPGLILTRVTGYGQTGPYAGRAGFGAIGEAMGGIRYITGSPDAMPSRVGVSLGDSLAGTFGALGTLVALQARHKTGRGQIVDSAIYEAVLALMESLLPEYELAGYTRERTGSVLPMIAPSNVYPTEGGDMILIAANQDSVFGRLTELMGRPDLVEDERYSTHTARGHNLEELDGIISEWSSGWDAEKLLEALHEAGVPAGRIYRAKDMLADPHFAAREMIVRLAHPQFGQFPMQNVVPKLSDTPGHVRHAGPELGAHNDEVFRDLLGLSEDDIAALRAQGTI